MWLGRIWIDIEEKRWCLEGVRVRVKVGSGNDYGVVGK